jgi:hypothetical protein
MDQRRCKRRYRNFQSDRSRHGFEGVRVVNRCGTKDSTYTVHVPYPRKDRDIPLRFLVHFLGDIHQPLHLTGRDRGGNGGELGTPGSVAQCLPADGTFRTQLP